MAVGSGARAHTIHAMAPKQQLRAVMAGGRGTLTSLLARAKIWPLPLPMTAVAGREGGGSNTPRA